MHKKIQVGDLKIEVTAFPPSGSRDKRWAITIDPNSENPDTCYLPNPITERLLKTAQNWCTELGLRKTTWDKIRTALLELAREKKHEVGYYYIQYGVENIIFTMQYFEDIIPKPQPKYTIKYWNGSAWQNTASK